MTITVEDGSIVTGANSYVDTTDLVTYATARGITLTGDPESLLIQAMDYIESLNYIGTKKTADQSLQWPRTGVWIDGYLFADDDIPEQLKNGEMECAIAIDQGNGPLNDKTPNVRRKKVDVIEVEYAPGASTNTINTRILNALKKLLAGGFGRNVINVSKA